MPDDVDGRAREPILAYITARCRDRKGGGVVQVHPGIMAVGVAWKRYVLIGISSGLTHDVIGE